MSYVQQTLRRTKVFATGTALAGFIQPSFPAAPEMVRPHLHAQSAGRCVVARTATPAAAASVAASPSHTAAVGAQARPARHGRVVALRSLPPPPITPPTLIVPPRPAVVSAGHKLPGRSAFVRTWEMDPQARPWVPRTVRSTAQAAAARRLAGAVIAFHAIAPPEEAGPEQRLAPHIVKAGQSKARHGRMAAARTPLVSGTLGLNPTNPATVRAAERRSTAPHVTVAAGVTAELIIHATPPMRAVAVAPVKRALKSAKVTTAVTATTPSLPTTPSVVVAVGKRPPARHGKVAATRAPIATSQPIPQPLAIVAGKAAKRAAKTAAAHSTAKNAASAAQTPLVRSVAVRPILPPKRTGKVARVTLPSGPAPLPRPASVRKGHAPCRSTPQPLTLAASGAPQPVPPKSRRVLAGRTAKAVPPLLSLHTWAPTPAQHGPLPQPLIITPGRYPARRAGRVRSTAYPVTWSVDGLPLDLPAAAIAWLRQYPDVASAFSEDLTATPPVRKLFGDWNLASASLPYLVYVEIDEGPYLFQSGSAPGNTYAFPAGQFQVSIFASGKRQARTLAEQVATALNDAPLTFSDGVLLELRLQSIHAVPEPDIGPTGAPVAYHFALTFLYRVQRSLNFT